MALAITATPDPGTWSVRLYVAGGTPPYVVTARPDGGRPTYTVQSPQTPVTGDASARNLIDGRAGLGTVSTVYTVADAVGASASTPAGVTLPATSPVLSNLFDPTRFVVATVIAQKPNRWHSRSVWYDVLGRRDPLIAVGDLRARGDSALTLAIDGAAARRALLDLLTTGAPLLIRTPCPNAVDDMTMLVADVTETLRDESDPDGGTAWELSYQAVTSDLGPFTGDPSRTYATVITGWPTYADLPPAYATYADLLTGSAYGNQGANLLTKGWASAPDAAAWNIGWSANVTLGSLGGVGVVTATAAAGTFVATLVPDVFDVVSVPGKRYRVTFRARLSAGTAGAQGYVDTVTNTAPGSANYFAAGAITASAPLVTLDGTWRTISYDATVPAGDDRLSVFFRVGNMANGSKAEIDNPQVREIL